MHASSVHMHTQGISTHTSCMWTHICAQKPRFKVLAIYLFCFVLITCLASISLVFHSFRSRLSTITCFTCLIDRLMIRVYALMNHMNMH